MWGRHAAAAGVDVAASLGPSPRGWRDAAEAMRRLGVRSLSEAVRIVHGAPLGSIRMARRGDLVRKGWALGICRGELAEFYGGVMAPMQQVDEAWAIERPRIDLVACD
ncbi:DUF6950 family protein [Sphingomonas sp. MMS24-J13]|uniref:DUF6950 family protein n=1 Tax=Sphingomonas sp. MMS24-J13 TaxID=3238686 RepID=UPI00384FAC85